MKKYIVITAIFCFGFLAAATAQVSLWDDIGGNNISNINTGNVILGNHTLGGPSNLLTLKNTTPANVLLNSFYTGTPASPRTLGAFRVLNSGDGEPAHQFFMGMRKLPDNNYDFVQSVFVDGTGWSEFSKFEMHTRNYLIMGGVNDFLINNSGGVGIGVSSLPEGYRFAVNGKVIAEELLIQKHAEWPDFVFGSDYSLMSLNELEYFINSNSHLPGVPSEKIIKEMGGFNVGEMTTILLQKVEELTLHIIELNKRIEELEK